MTQVTNIHFKNMKFPLKEVTLVCIDTRNIKAAIDSMSCSLSQVNFAQSILFTNEALISVEIKNRIKTLNIHVEFIEKISSITEYSYFILFNLCKYIDTEYCLVTQWDSWVINNKYWDSNFFKYDYIGAIWPQHSSNNIGNGGFSLRSKKMLESTRDFLKSRNNLPSILIEDDFICRENRKIFEDKYHIKFPSTDIANNFSVERNGNPIKSFGFHGFFNFNFVIQDDVLLKKLIRSLIKECFVDVASYDLTKSLLKEKRISVAKIVIKRRLKATGITTKNVRLVVLLFIKILKLY